MVTVTRGACSVTLSAGSHSGDIELHDLVVSAVRGCSRSGDRARRNSGDPGSDPLHGRPPNDAAPAFLQPAAVAGTDAADPGPAAGVAAELGADSSAEGLYDCVVLELPGWWPAGENVRGLGDRVGDCGSGDGDGVRANGDSGMWPTDLRRFGECKFLVAECSLCLSPCSVDGRWYGAAAAAELGDTVGDELADELDELVDDE